MEQFIEIIRINEFNHHFWNFAGILVYRKLFLKILYLFLLFNISRVFMYSLNRENC